MNGAQAVALDEARQNDRETLRMLVTEYSHKVFRLGYRLTGNEQDAEDVVQETFLRAYRSLERYESRAQLSSWIFRIATNYAIDLQRRKGRWRTSPLERHEEISPLTSAEPGPEREASSGQLRERIDRALERLTERERAAFTLRHYEGLSIKEIGGLMSISVGATKNHLFRAVRKLRRTLGPLMDGMS